MHPTREARSQLSYLSDPEAARERVLVGSVRVDGVVVWEGVSEGALMDDLGALRQTIRSWSTPPCSTRKNFIITFTYYAVFKVLLL